MGFRDIHCHNLALLAKQAWRLFDQPNSLCATILRAKYFPDGNLLGVVLKKGSSASFGAKLSNLDEQGPEHNEVVWNVIWKLQAPAKVKKILRKTLHGALPCRMVLADRHIKVSGLCPVCGVASKDICHMLFRRPRAMEVWQNLGLLHDVERACLLDMAGSAVLDFLLVCAKQQNRTLDHGLLSETFAIAAWYIWWERRQIVNGKPAQNPKHSATCIRAMIARFSTACNHRASIKGWICPPLGLVKLNVDASFDGDSLSGSMGAVIRDDKGHFIAAADESIPSCPDAHVAEAMAQRLGLELALSYGCHRLVVNANNLEVIDTMKKGAQSATLTAAVYKDCLGLSTEFIRIEYDHCHREANQVAHIVAAISKSAPPRIWDDDPPLDIVRLLVSNVNPITIIKCCLFVKKKKRGSKGTLRVTKLQLYFEAGFIRSS
ncbi:hypothetical protein BRADI_5g25075v3 [Brachypodium distachyon]|uniref:RNase H type-1 domain-containing protein n=1 Tax=Brachypodium distachyon TaxID=15368 RepID=A0A2K2CJ68_BRADI|nr:hypothetical protein BRADI_5g25075v3 [Brachypodium distachyon]